MITSLLILSIVISAIIWKNPKFVFACSLCYPVLSLPFYIKYGYEIGRLNVLVEAICLISLFVLLRRREKRGDNYEFHQIYFVLFFLVIYGLLTGIDNRPAIILLLGIKLLLIPFFISSAFTKINDIKFPMIVSLFLVQIANGLAAILETLLGIQKLQSFGFEYGTNLRNFDSFLRAPGLARTNYELGSFSSIILVLVYLVLTNQIETIRKINQRFAVCAGTFSSICLILSNFRSGIVFALLCIFFCELISRKNILGSIYFLVVASCLILAAILGNFFLLDSRSTFDRVYIWSDLLHAHNWILGSGIGFTGAATRSSFASGEDLIVTDNQFLSMLLQYGIVGFICTSVILIYLFFIGNAVTKSLVASLCIMMVFVEVWDLTLFFTLVLCISFDGVSSKKRKSLA